MALYETHRVVLFLSEENIEKHVNLSLGGVFNEINWIELKESWARVAEQMFHVFTDTSTGKIVVVVKGASHYAAVLDDIRDRLDEVAHGIIHGTAGYPPITMPIADARVMAEPILERCAMANELYNMTMIAHETCDANGQAIAIHGQILKKCHECGAQIGNRWTDGYLCDNASCNTPPHGCLIIYDQDVVAILLKVMDNLVKYKHIYI